jgi:hypothetical protein
MACHSRQARGKLELLNYYQPDNCYASLRYARYYVMPNSAHELRQNIEAAVWDRTNRADLIKNEATMMQNNIKCRVCGVTH